MQAPDPELYEAHIERLTIVWEAALAGAQFDAAVLTAGSQAPYLFDDQAPPFRPNPHLARWFPSRDCEHAALLVRPGRRPRLYLYQPEDYWHLVPEPPAWAEPMLELRGFDDAEKLAAALADDLAREGRVALIGAPEPSNLPVAAHNPAGLLAPLDHDRAYKTPFELASMRAATRSAVRGHRAAADAFAGGASEFAIHCAYLEAASHTAADLPYASIVALNDHAGVLHYQYYERTPPGRRHSFLIDAGATHLGYACDITRTYAAVPDSQFAALIEALDAEQRALIESIRPGVEFVDLHIGMHRRVARVLAEAGIVTRGAERAFDDGVTESFLPHGLGHLIGLQTHDVGGQQITPDGSRRAPPDNHPALRLTRPVEPGMVFTIEPGIYFIPMLLRRLRTSGAGSQVDWQRVHDLLPCGGIRIEDNVLVTATGIENFTREAFAA